MVFKMNLRFDFTLQFYFYVIKFHPRRFKAMNALNITIMEGFVTFNEYIFVIRHS